MKNNIVSTLLKFLPRFIPRFPLILNSAADIVQAEHSGDLSFGMYNDFKEPTLPDRIRYILSFMFMIPDPQGQEKLFFPHMDKTSWPFSPNRIVLQHETKDKLKKAIQQFKSMDKSSSALVRYMQYGRKITEQNNNLENIEVQARIELISLILHQWNDKIRIDHKFLECLDVFTEARSHPLKNIFFPNRKKLETARNYIQSLVGDDVLLYHHAFASGSTLWKGIKKLRMDIGQPAFKQMLNSGNWSPAAFLVQNKIAAKSLMRVTVRKTNLGGLLRYHLDRGRLVLLSNRDSARDSDDLFNHLCCGADFIMEILTILVDNIHPGLRKIPINNASCPYSKKISQPLYY